MKRYIVLATFCFVCLFLLSCQSAFWPQEKPGKDQPISIEGDWTVVIRDWGSGGILCLVPDPNRCSFEGREPITVRWKITKESIEVGKDIEGCFPTKRYTYRLNPGNQANTIDLRLDEVDLDIADKDDRRTLDATAKKVQQGIFFVKDDYLFICIGRNSRPKSLTVYEKDNPARIEVLRRGRLWERNDKDASDPKHKKE